mgnify:CR=1 FL=1
MKIQHKIDWRNPEERLAFENELNSARCYKKKRPFIEKVGWFVSVFLLQLVIIVSLYGPCAYFIVSLATAKKKEEELVLMQKCRNATIYLEKCDSKKMVYYDLLNYILINLYPFLTCFCQGTAYLCACLWHVTTYRFWNLLGGIIACLCLPVDILIFYVEPLGFVGTTASMVLGFIPFCIIIADAAFPIKSINVVANGKKIQVNRNSWTEDISISYNQRYNFVARTTLKGWTAFSTLALCIALFKGPTVNENALGAVIFALVCIPQMISMSLVMIHWDANFDQNGFELFESSVDMPLVLWYLSFYCSPRTKNAVIGKLLVNYISIAISRYEDYADKYIYVEFDITETERSELQDIEIKYLKRCGLTYDVSKVINVSAHQIFSIFACPFVGLWESFKAINYAFIRDLNKF